MGSLSPLHLSDILHSLGDKARKKNLCHKNITTALGSRHAGLFDVFTLHSLSTKKTCPSNLTLPASRMSGLLFGLTKCGRAGDLSK